MFILLRLTTLKYCSNKMLQLCHLYTLAITKKLEFFILFFFRYGFGSAGNANYDIPGGAMLQYKIKLSTFEKAKESWEMNTAEKLEQSSVVKEKGTQYFKVCRDGFLKYSTKSDF